MIRTMPVVCVLCGGPIGTGEPVVVIDDGLAHRFKTTCEWHRNELSREHLVQLKH